MRQRARRGWLFAVTSGIAVLAYAVFTKHVWLPFGAWALFLARLDRATRVFPVYVTMDRVQHGARSIPFHQMRSVRLLPNGVAVESATAKLVFETTLLDLRSRELLVRHIEARMLLARIGRRAKAERVALEALHVFQAEAVRVYKRSAIEVLRGDGPWSVSRRERLYVRQRPMRAGYRINARADAIEIGALE